MYNDIYKNQKFSGQENICWRAYEAFVKLTRCCLFLKEEFILRASLVNKRKSVGEAFCISRRSARYQARFELSHAGRFISLMAALGR